MLTALDRLRNRPNVVVLCTSNLIESMVCDPQHPTSHNLTIAPGLRLPRPRRHQTTHTLPLRHSPLRNLPPMLLRTGAIRPHCADPKRRRRHDQRERRRRKSLARHGDERNPMARPERRLVAQVRHDAVVLLPRPESTLGGAEAVGYCREERCACAVHNRTKKYCADIVPGESGPQRTHPPPLAGLGHRDVYHE